MELNSLARPSLGTEPTLGTAIWLLQLRWVAVAGQLLTIGIVAFGLGIDLQIVPLITMVSATAATNIAYGVWLVRLRASGMKAADRLSSNRLVGILMILDMVILTGLLYWSGGTANPFLLFYFVNLSVSGLILPPSWAWSLTAISIIEVLGLLFFHVPVLVLNVGLVSEEPFWSVRKQGFVVAFATSCCVVTYFVTALNRELRLRELQLQEAENQRNRSRRLEALATLAAGAGHELASPLSTIAVVTKELSRNLDKHQASDSTRRDVALIRSELDRCRDILNRMKSSAGEAAAEQLDPVSVAQLVDETLLGLREPNRIHVYVDPTIKTEFATLPIQALAQALRNLLQNGLDASPQGEIVKFELRVSRVGWEIEVRDTGVGMPPIVLQRIGEPFFTTKQPGQGMGLGVFLTRNVVQRLGGTIEIESTSGNGTVCRIDIPVDR